MHATSAKKLFGSEDEAPEKIKAHIEEANPGVSNLEVTVKDGVAFLSGEAESAEAMEKAVLMAGNVKGISEVRADGLAAPATEVKKASEYPRIFEANRKIIKDPDLIDPGQKIRIPLY